jgi:hypothetical protein
MALNQSINIIWSQSNENYSANVTGILDQITQRFLVHLPLILTILGIIGFLGNTFTYFQPTLRYNNCCIYSLCGSFIDIINLFVNLFPHYINKTVGNLVISQISNSFQCKLKFFILVFFPQLSMNFLILSLIDQYVGTCSATSPMRHFRRLKSAPWLIFSTILFSCLMSIYSYDIRTGIWNCFLFFTMDLYIFILFNY